MGCRTARKVYGVDDRYSVRVDARTVAALRRVCVRMGWDYPHVIGVAVHLLEVCCSTSTPLVGVAKLERAAAEARERERGPTALDVDGVMRRIRREMEG